MQIYKDTQLLNNYIQKYHLDDIIGEGLKDQYEFHLFQKGELVCKMDEPVYYFYFLLDGKVKVFTMSEDGRILLLEFYKQLSTYGDIEILNDTYYRSNVEVIKESLLLALPVHFIHSACLNRKSFLKYLCLSLSMKFDSSSQKSSYNILYPLKNRLAGFIIEHIMDENQEIITLTSSFKEIAESLGTSYRHLNRSLNELKNLNIIDMSGKQIRILDETMLRKLSKEL